jgi:hypothetical protein
MLKAILMTLAATATALGVSVVTTARAKRAASPTLDGETVAQIAASDVSSKCDGRILGATINWQASGTARGVYAGTFTATGTAALQGFLSDTGPQPERACVLSPANGAQAHGPRLDGCRHRGAWARDPRGLPRSDAGRRLASCRSADVADLRQAGGGRGCARPAAPHDRPDALHEPGRRLQPGELAEPNLRFRNSTRSADRIDPTPPVNRARRAEPQVRAWLAGPATSDHGLRGEAPRSPQRRYIPIWPRISPFGFLEVWTLT